MEANEPLFANPPIQMDALPRADELDLTPLEPAYRSVRILSAAAFSAVVVLVVWSVAITQPDWHPFGWIIAAVVTLLAGSSIYYSAISYRYMGYALRDKDITFQQGWLWKSTATIPFNRVQHCDIRQGLLDRRFGLAKLTVYTAGGESSDIEVPGLLQAHAEQLKTFILQATEKSIETP